MTYERNEEELRHGKELMRLIHERIAKEQARLPPRREKMGWEFYRACKKADEDFAKIARAAMQGRVRPQE